MKRLLPALIAAAFLSLGVSTWVKSEEAVKKPNVSGQFYSADSRELSAGIDKFFHAAKVTPSNKKIELMICPHAGYVYSGVVAAYGYKAASKGQYRTILIIAPSHYADFEGFAIWPRGSFLTPLGKVDVDDDFCKKLMAASSKIKDFSLAFEREHAVEVQIPFLQKTFNNFKIVPLLTGRPSFKNCQELAAALNTVIAGRDDVLIIISTDMSHYYEGKTARRMDDNVLNVIKNLNVDDFWVHALRRDTMEMCGFVGVTTALIYAKAKDLTHAEILKYANSGDVTGDWKSVVGYCSVAFSKEENKTMDNGITKQDQEVPLLTAQQKKWLLEIARKTIETYITKGEVFNVTESDPRLLRKEGAFVTIHNHGNLRGCIGNIIGQGPLYKTVRDMAIASATQDSRFSPVAKSELKDIDIEISVLSEPRRITNTDEIKMGIHGVIVKRGPWRQGVFLPQVATETGWNKEQFMANLCLQKAGLPPDAWKDPKTIVEIFTAQVFSEKDIPK